MLAAIRQNGERNRHSCGWAMASARKDQGGSDSVPRSPRCIILDFTRRFGSQADSKFSETLAQAFFKSGYEVGWIVAEDDPILPRSYAEICRVSLPSLMGPDTRAVESNPNILRPLLSAVSHRWWILKRVCKRLAWTFYWQLLHVARRLTPEAIRRTWGSPTLRLLWRSGETIACEFENILQLISRILRRTSRVTSGPKQIEDFLADCGPADVVILPSASWRCIEEILALVPRLKVDRPLATTLHVRFSSRGGLPTEKGSIDIDTIGPRLRSGSPFRHVFFHSDDEASRNEQSRQIEAIVHPLSSSFAAEGQEAYVLERFAPYPGTGDDRPSALQPSIIIDEFGPFVLLVSALWGRVGSTSSFDSQTKYLIHRGCVVARLFIEHYPRGGPAQNDRIAMLVPENFEKVRPHFHFVVERNDTPRELIRLSALPEFRNASPVSRMGLLLKSARPVANSDGLAWAAGKSGLAIVHHLPHVRYTQRITRAPIVLDTHDIFSKLLDTHGIPGFVHKWPDGMELRTAEEREVWRDGAGCANLSPSENEIISAHARASWLVKLYVPRKVLRTRAWPEVVAANNLPARLRASSNFDVMLWGSFHNANIAGITWFLKSVIPLQPRLAASRVLVAGRVIQGMSRVLAQHPNVIAVGFVEDIDDFAARSKVLVIPDLAGTGMSRKVLDALALGACFASTAAGMRDLDLGRGGYRSSVDAKELAEDIEHLLASPAARSERSRVALELYKLNVSEVAYYRAWDSI